MTWRAASCGLRAVHPPDSGRAALAAADRPSKRGHVTPMQVMDAPYRAGICATAIRPWQTICERSAHPPAEGIEEDLFKNFMDARVRYVILPIAQRLMTPAQAAQATAEGYMAGTLLHEIAHELGPEFSRVNGKQVDTNEAIGPPIRAWKKPRRMWSECSASSGWRTTACSRRRRWRSSTRLMWPGCSGPSGSAAPRRTGAPRPWSSATCTAPAQ